MTHDDLERKLKAYEIPEPAQDLMSRQIEKARLAFIHEPALVEKLSAMRTFGFAKGALAGALFTAVAFFIFNYLSPFETGRPANVNLAQDQKILQEMQNVFQGSLQAVVSNGGSPKVILGADNSEPGTLPVAIELSSHGKQYKILSFSGQSIEVTINGEVLKFEVYLSGDGRVVLVSKNGVINGEKGGLVGDFQARAYSLGVSS